MMRNYLSRQGTMMGVLMLLAAPLFALDVAKIQTKGYLDLSYNYNLAGAIAPATPLRSYDAQSDTLLLNAVHVDMSGILSPESSFNVQVDYGSDTIINHSAPYTAAVPVDLQEGIMIWSPAALPTFSLTAGKFVTTMGIELIESPDNPTITRGYLYNLAEPFTHTGVKVSFAPIPLLELGAGVVNGWDLMADNNSGKTGIGKLGINMGDPLAMILSASYGPEQPGNSLNQRTSTDIVVTTKLIPMTVLYLQGNYGQEEFGDKPEGMLSVWRGAGVQPVIALLPGWNVGLRYEQWVDGSHARSSVSESNSFSICPAWSPTESLTARLEYRYDQATDEVFTDPSGAPKGCASTVSAQMVQRF